MTRRSLTLFALVMLCGAPIALPASRAGAQTASSSEAIDAEAHSLFEAGRSAYSDGRFDDALGYFRRAYELSHRPELLYNIGQCQDRLRHDTEALEVFEEFLVALPNAPQRSQVTARVQIPSLGTDQVVEVSAPATITATTMDGNRTFTWSPTARQSWVVIASDRAATYTAHEVDSPFEMPWTVTAVPGT